MSKLELIKKLKDYARKMPCWDNILFYCDHAEHYNLMDLVWWDIHEQVVEMFGDTRGIDLIIDPRDIVTDFHMNLETDEEDEKREFYDNALEHNYDMLLNLSDNIKKFIKIVEKEMS